ncbi:hypothetical protein ACWHLZ_14345 [Streptomyces chartreusis]
MEEKRTSPRRRSVLASAVTVAALVVAPLAGAGTALAMDNPYPPHPTKPGHPYPPYPPKPPGHDHDHDHDGHHPGKPDHGWDGHDGGEEGHDQGPGREHLADTGDNDNDKELILGGVAAALVAAGAGTVLVVRRRHGS